MKMTMAKHKRMNLDSCAMREHIAAKDRTRVRSAAHRKHPKMGKK